MVRSNGNQGQERKDKFYEKLRKIIPDVPRYGIKIIVGDLNAKVRGENIYKNRAGGHSKHKESNKKGIKLMEIATEMKRMCITFQRKEDYKAT